MLRPFVMSYAKACLRVLIVSLAVICLTGAAAAADRIPAAVVMPGTSANALAVGQSEPTVDWLDDVQLVQAKQPPAVAPPKATPPQPTTPPPPAAPAPTPTAAQRRRLRELFSQRRSSLKNRPVRSRLASIPDIFGDSLLPSIQFSISDYYSQGDTIIDVPLGTQSGAVKISDNNRAIPTDRVYGTYHHFHNIGQISDPAAGTVTDLSFNQFLLGIEKTLDNGWMSVEFRLPLLEQMQYSDSSLTLEGGSVGDFTVITKALMYADDDLALAIGMAIQTPTGADLQVEVITPFVGDLNRFTFQNESVHLIPFIGLSGQVSDRAFFHLFCQLDTPVNEQGLQVEDVNSGTSQTETVDPQTILQLDGVAGYWLRPADNNAFISSIAAVLELHLATSLEERDIPSDIVTSSGFYSMQAGAETFSMVNITTGLYTQLGDNHALRVAGVFPLSGGSGRAFDSELIVQLTRRY
ncbi:MAG: hypothetical protein ABGZ17_02955 [Planctomycetaceae bacterium]